MSVHVCDPLQVANKRRIQIAIDGPAAAGKSTIGLGLARALSCRYLDTGLMYRAVTWLALSSGANLSDPDEMAALSQRMQFSVDDTAGSVLLVDGRHLGDRLRSSEVDSAVSRIAAHGLVRAVLVREQRRLAGGGCVVMVGRDIGTVVLPSAEVKFWITASPVERAKRRRAETANVSPNEAEELARIQSRDSRDAGREVSPLRQADDAIVIETDGLSRDDVLAEALLAVSRRLDAGPPLSH